MPASRPVAGVLTIFCAGWFVCLAASAAVCRSLYGDGAWVVLSELANPLHYNDYDFHRSFASYITQTPLLLGERMGMRNVTAYAALYTLGIEALPAALFVFALFIARGTPTLFAVTAGAIAVFGFGVNVVNSEANLLFALVWLSTVILALPGRRPVLRGYVLPLIALALLRVYEGMLLAGPVLAIQSFAMARRHRGSEEQPGLTIATLAFVVATLIGFSGFVAPRDAGNASNFQANVVTYLSDPQAFLLASALLSMASASIAQRRMRWLCLAASGAAACVFVGRMLDLHGYYAYRLYYFNRSFLVLLLPIFVGGALFATRHHAPFRGARDPRVALIAAVMPFVAVVVVDLAGSVRWMSYMRTFCGVLDDPGTASQGIEHLRHSGTVMGTRWTHPALSVLLRRQGSHAMVQNDPGEFQPFDPGGSMKISYRGACGNRRFAGTR